MSRERFFVWGLAGPLNAPAGKRRVKTGSLRKDRKYLAAKQQSGLQKAIEGS